MVGHGGCSGGSDLGGGSVKWVIIRLVCPIGSQLLDESEFIPDWLLEDVFWSLL
jgi:hypothetical protein